MMNIKVNGELITNVVGIKFCRDHGLMSIKETSDFTQYKGYFQGNYFDILIAYDYVSLEEYKNEYKDVNIGEAYEVLINFCENKEVNNDFINHNICHYMAID